MRRVRRFWKVALIGGVAALAFAVVGPVFGSSHVDADHLRMTDYDDGVFEDYFGFFYGADNPSGLPASGLQPFGFSSGCLISGKNGPLVTISSKSPNNRPGVHNLGLGVKSGGSNGTPCSETAAPEKLTISAAAGQVWDGLRLDVQPKSNAWVLVTLHLVGGQTETHELLTGGAIDHYNTENGTSETPRNGATPPFTATTDPNNAALGLVEACANKSDSGPDSGPNDNCIWTIIAGGDFTMVELTTKSGWGSVALEGGADFEGVDADDFDGDSFDTLFYRGNSVPYALGPLSATEGTPTNYGVDDLAADDDGDGLTLQGTPTADNGTATLNGNSIDYTPDENFCGDDTLYFTVSDGVNDPVDLSITINVTCVNDPPVPNGADNTEDAYEVDERKPIPLTNPLQFQAVTLEVPAAGVLSNDTDPEGDAITVYSVDDSATLGTVSWSADGSFSYTPTILAEEDPWTAGDPLPNPVDSWEEIGVFSYTDTFSYVAQDSGGALSSSATVTITVHRVVCSEETVRDVDFEVFGAFTLLQADGDPPKCKRYAVFSHGGENENEVDFITEAEDGVAETFRGLLSFKPEQQSAGEYTLGLFYDPDFDPSDPDNFNPQPLPQCIDPVYELGVVDVPGFPSGYQTMLVVDADFVALAALGHSWCWAGDITIPGGGVEVETIRQVIGQQDPRFSGGI